MMFEITDKNLEWSVLKGIETTFEDGYTETVDLLKLLIRLKSPHRVAVLLPTILEFENELTEFANTEFFDEEDDSDLLARKNRARTMLAEIDALKQQLL